MYEHRKQPILPRERFVVRQLKHLGAGGVLIAGSLAIGTVGYRVFEGTSWIDSVYGAAMILTGMGPAVTVQTTAAKVFLIFYSIFSGVVFLTVAALLLVPVLHRVMHALHAEDEQEEEIAKRRKGTQLRK